MTDQELADKLAVAMSCRRDEGGYFDSSGRRMGHPFPVGDLNALAAAWPEGWYIRVEGCAWQRWRVIGTLAGVSGVDEIETDGDTEWSARAALLLAAKEACNADH